MIPANSRASVLSIATLVFAMIGELAAREPATLPARSMMERRYLDMEPIRKDPVMKWKTRTVQGIAREEWTHVLVHEGVVYGTAKGVLHAIDAMTGKLLWTIEGPIGHPTIHDGVLYVTGTDNLYAIDLQTRAVKWQVDASPMHSVWRMTNAGLKPAVVIHEGVAYF
ncbi:MAG: PQQ-binding-like beta-propeller repeat protein [Gemmataceae bacterium]